MTLKDNKEGVNMREVWGRRGKGGKGGNDAIIISKEQFYKISKLQLIYIKIFD